MVFGKHDISHAHNLSGHGNAIIPLFFATPSAIIAAALSEGKVALSSGVDIHWPAALIGMAAAVVCGVLAIKAIEWIVKKDHYNYFGYYCAVLGVLVVIMSIVEKTTGVSNIVELFK